MSKILLTDLDETILHSNVAIERFCSELLKKEATSSVINVRKAYDIGEDIAYELIHGFWNSDYMNNLEPEESAKIVLPRLHAQGWEFVAITACANEPDIIAAREENLEKAFGFKFKKVICSGYLSVGPDGKNKKAEILSQFEPTIWVEDAFHNALAGALLGHKTFLMHREHNENSENDIITRVPNWFEVEKYIQENNL